MGNGGTLAQFTDSVRKQKSNYFMVKLVAAWALFMLLLVFGVKRYWGDGTKDPQPMVSETTAKDNIPVADLLFLHEGIPLCKEVFSGFLAAPTNEARLQYVMNPVSTAERMSQFSSMNQQVFIDYANLSLISSAALHLPTGRGIETQWNFKDNRIIDVVFMENSGQWRLDWEHYIRYSFSPLVSFLAENGKGVGEFRLLARERLAEERKNKDTLSIVFYTPQFGYPSNTGFTSPEFIVPRASKNGRLLEAAFKLEKSGQRAFDVKLRKTELDGLIRVRVRIRRYSDGKDKERRFELEDVVACHWYSSDAPGGDIPGKPVNK